MKNGNRLLGLILMVCVVALSLSGCVCGHEWLEATCTAPKTCSKCSKTEGEPLGHEWIEATYTEPKTCTVCGKEEGGPLTAEYSNKSSSNSAGRYCEECYKIALHTYTNPVSGGKEYYCEEHYQEIMDILDMMESDVGESSVSSHQCEECSKEGTHSITGISGLREYYCTEHYNELRELMELLGMD